MSRCIRHATLSLAASLVAVLVTGAGAAHAGAVVQRDSGCTELGASTYCFEASIEHNVVETPSGNLSDAANGTISSSITTDGVVVYADSRTIHQHFLYKDLFLHEQHQSGVFEIRTPFSVCTFTGSSHAVGFDIQYSRLEIDCTPAV